jgi:hypothetical protein
VLTGALPPEPEPPPLVWVTTGELPAPDPAELPLVWVTTGAEEPEGVEADPLLEVTGADADEYVAEPVEEVPVAAAPLDGA